MRNCLRPSVSPFFLCLVLIGLFYSGQLYAQNEKFIRGMYTGTLTAKDKYKPQNFYKWVVSTKEYQIDLNEDGFYESIQVHKKDGEDWFNLHDRTGESVFSFKLDNLGPNSHVYKVSIKQIAKNVQALIVHFYEGAVDYINFSGSAVLYFVTIENHSFRKAKVFKGPKYFIEKADFPERYYRRSYQIKTFDYNKDGIKEIAIKYKKLSRVYFYSGAGQWAAI